MFVCVNNTYIFVSYSLLTSMLLVAEIMASIQMDHK